MQRSIFSTFFMMLTATSLVVAGDTAGKLLAQAGFSQFFVGWSRFVIASLVLLPFSGLKRSELRGLLDWRVIFRSALIAGAICAILTAINTEPLANVFGAFFIAPIIAYFTSAAVLGEQISWRRTVLLAISFVGVLVVVRPGFGMTPGVGFGLLAGILHGLYQVTTRWLVELYRPRFLLISQLIVGAVILSPFGLAQTGLFDSRTIGLLLISALASAFGNFALLLVSRSTPASVVAPLIYTQLIAAVFLGYVVFAEWPDTQTMLGLVIILATGLSSLWFANRGK